MREQLQAQLLQLDLQASLLRQERGIVDPKVAVAKNALNADLRAAVQQQDVHIATVQSAFSGYVVRLYTTHMYHYPCV